MPIDNYEDITGEPKDIVTPAPAILDEHQLAQRMSPRERRAFNRAKRREAEQIKQDSLPPAQGSLFGG